MDEFPSDINYNILSRIPIKSLARFQCASKIWSDYIDDPYFATCHAKRNKPSLVMFRQCLGDLPNLPCTLGFPRITDDFGAVVVSKNPVMEFYSKRTSDRFHKEMVLGFCYGLVYSTQNLANQGTSLVVIQPLKKEGYKLPLIKTYPGVQPLARELTGLGYDDSTNTFKMVYVWVIDPAYLSAGNICTMVHDLGTVSWRRIPKNPAYPITGESVFARGCLHWLVWSDAIYSRTKEFGEKIISFDLKTEEFGLIDAPKHTRGPVGWINHQLVDLDGELGFAYNHLATTIELWVLKEEGWVMHCRFDQQKTPLPNSPVEVLGYWNKDGDILLTTNEPTRLFVYDLKNDVVHNVNICGLREDGSKTYIRMYKRSMLSLRHITGKTCQIKI